MAPYYSIDLEYFFLMLGIAVILIGLIILARGVFKFSYSFRKQRESEIDNQIHEFGGGVQEQYRPVPLLIWTLIIGYFFWAIGYSIYISYTGY